MTRIYSSVEYLMYPSIPVSVLGSSWLQNQLASSDFGRISNLVLFPKPFSLNPTEVITLNNLEVCRAGFKTVAEKWSFYFGAVHMMSDQNLLI